MLFNQHISIHMYSDIIHTPFSPVLIPMGGIVPSAPDINQTLSFGAGSTSPFLTFRLSLMDDKVAVEAQETFLLVLSSPSSPRVQIGGRNERFNVDFFPNATVTIIDDDREFR